MFFLIVLECEQRLHEDRTLKTLLLDGAADLVRLADIAVEEVSVRVAAARAEEPRPAVATFLLVEHVALAEVLRELRTRDALAERAEAVALAADELMAGIEIAVFRDGEILMARAAARKALRDAGAV